MVAPNYFKNSLFFILVAGYNGVIVTGNIGGCEGTRTPETKMLVLVYPPESHPHEHFTILKIFIYTCWSILDRILTCI